MNQSKSIKCDGPVQTISKAEFHEEKIMLSIWCSYKGFVYFQLLPRSQTINSGVYCQTFNRTEEKDKRKTNRTGKSHYNRVPQTQCKT